MWLLAIILDNAMLGFEVPGRPKLEDFLCSIFLSRPPQDSLWADLDCVLKSLCSHDFHSSLTFLCSVYRWQKAESKSYLHQAGFFPCKQLEPIQVSRK